jgi:hypothetical protein
MQAAMRSKRNFFIGFLLYGNFFISTFAQEDKANVKIDMINISSPPLCKMLKAQAGLLSISDKKRHKTVNFRF